MDITQHDHRLLPGEGRELPEPDVELEDFSIHRGADDQPLEARRDGVRPGSGRAVRPPWRPRCPLPGAGQDAFEFRLGPGVGRLGREERVAILVVIAGGDRVPLEEPLGAGHGGLGVVHPGLGFLGGGAGRGDVLGPGAETSLWSWALAEASSASRTSSWAL